MSDDKYYLTEEFFSYNKTSNNTAKHWAAYWMRQFNESHPAHYEYWSWVGRLVDLKEQINSVWALTSGNEMIRYSAHLWTKVSRERSEKEKRDKIS